MATGWRATAVSYRVGLTMLLAVLMLGLNPAARVQVQVPTGRSDTEVPLNDAERAWLAKHPVIRVAPDPDFSPIEFFDATGVYRGIAADYLALLEQRLPVRLEVVRLPTWDEVLARAKRREVDLLGAAVKTVDRTEYLRFTSPHIQLTGAIIATTDSSETLTLEELEGHQVAVVSGYFWHEMVANDHPDIKLIAVPNIITALQMTSFGVVDAMVGDVATTTHFIRQEGFTNLRVAGKPPYTYDLSLATRKDWPELRSILDKALATISREERAEIQDRWILLKMVSIFRKREFWYATIGSSLLVLLVVGGILAWNRSLQRQVAERTSDLNAELDWRCKAEEELRQHRDHLSDLVEERTAKLQAANEQMKQDLAAAARLQQSLLPQSPPDIVGARFLWHYRPSAELAGDILNVFQLDRDHVGMYLVDVSGHGVAASLLSVAVSHVLTPVPSKASLLVQLDETGPGVRVVPPAQVVHELNKRFPMKQADDRYFTILYGILNVKTRLFRYVSAGHPQIIHCAPGGEPQMMYASGIPVGFFPETEYDEVIQVLESGDRLCIHSDGISEAMNVDMEQFGSTRIIQAMAETRSRSLDECVSAVTWNVEQWCAGSGPQDDVSLLAIEIV